MNITDGNLSDILRGRVGISRAFKDKINFKYGVNLDWLEHGVGEPILKRGAAISEAKEGVPYFNISLADTENLVLEE